MKADIFNEYADKVCEIFAIDRESLFTKSKRRDIVDARQMLYYLCYKRPMRLVYIQEYMAENGYPINHSSVLHGISVAKGRYKKDKDYVRVIKEVE